MNNDMIWGLALTIGSFFFIILLLIVYYLKERFLSIRNKIYRYMLIVNIILIITELISSFMLAYYNNDTANYIMLRIHWSTGIAWLFFLYYYSCVFIENVSASNLYQIIKYSWKTKVMFVLFVIVTIVYFFIPFSKPDSNNISYIPGPAAYYTLGFCSIVVMCIIILMFGNRKQMPIRKRATIWFMVAELFALFVFQISFQNVAIEAIGAVIQMYFLYFNIENPDLKIISELESVKSDIERSNKAKSDFLSNMSHEIRTPMNAIVGFSQTLLNEPYFDENRCRNDIKHISSAGNNLLDIINNILDISKIESGKETLEKKEYSIGNIVLELKSIIDARLSDRPIKFIVDVNNDVPAKLYGDSTKVFQILLNILTNSAKYTEVGKITLKVNADIKNDKALLHFKISDTGYGIKEEDSDKLFKKFSRLDDATSNEIEGTGLGLVITKKYVDLMGGKIWIESEYEVGTTFYVDFEQKIVDFNSIGKITDPVKTDKSPSEFLDCSSYSILIVDDNKLNIKVASRLLEAYKFKIDTASGGKECIYKVKEGKHYDMIFLDHMMPEIDGIKTLHILKKLEGYYIPPIVALTANAITGMKEMYLKEGFDEYLSKPINVAELNKIINKYFKGEEK